MKWRRIVDAVFPHIEPLSPAKQAIHDQRLVDDEAAIRASTWPSKAERALDEAERVADADMERVRTSEGKATTYLAVLAALVPIIITLQTANWEKKSGPAPDAARLIVLAVATVYIAAAGYHAFKTLQVAGFQRVGEAELVDAWHQSKPLQTITRSTLLASRRSRDAVNAKVTRIRVTHEHLLRAFGTFILLLLLDPLFYAVGYRNAAEAPAPTWVIVERLPTSARAPSPECRTGSPGSTARTGAAFSGTTVSVNGASASDLVAKTLPDQGRRGTPNCCPGRPPAATEPVAVPTPSPTPCSATRGRPAGGLGRRRDAAPGLRRHYERRGAGPVATVDEAPDIRMSTDIPSAAS